MSEKSKRIVMSVFGVVVCGLSVGLLRHAALGVELLLEDDRTLLRRFAPDDADDDASAS